MFTISHTASRRWLVPVALAGCCLLPAAVTSTRAVQAQGAPTPTTAPRFRFEDLAYQGYFRLPSGSGTEQSFEYGGTALAYYAAHGSLLLVGHDWHQRVAEISIPTVANVPSLGSAPTATLRQSFVDLLEGRIGSIGSGTAKIGGLLVSRDSLTISAYLYYDGNGSQVLSHFRSSLDLSRAGDLQGPFQLGTAGAGFVSGYMTSIPPEWQAPLGGTALTGQCCIPVISRTSYGPAVSVFSPEDVAAGKPVPATPLVGYPESHPTLGAWEKQNPYFNMTTEVVGVVFPAGTRSVLFFGRYGLGAPCYGTGGASGGECVDPADSNKGNHGYPYTYRIWAYDAVELMAVKNRQKKPWEVRPYQAWNFELPNAAAQRRLAGVAYDPATRRLFVSASYGDGGQPLIHVFTLKQHATGTL
jgi:hypothetical protein